MALRAVHTLAAAVGHHCTVCCACPGRGQRAGGRPGPAAYSVGAGSGPNWASAFTPRINLNSLGWTPTSSTKSRTPKKTSRRRSRGSSTGGSGRAIFALQGATPWTGCTSPTTRPKGGTSHRHNLRLEYRLNRLRPYATGNYASVKDRPGYEIDARARHTETAFGAGLDVRFGGKTHGGIAARQTTSVFDGDAVFEGSSLAEALNRKAEYGSVTFRYRATSLTALTLLGEAGRERFDESPERDNDSFRIMPGIELDPFALVRGKARVGYRRIEAISPMIPDFEGVVAAADLSYVLLGRTRFAVAVDRDVQFSYEVDQPDHLFTGVNGSVRQGLGLGWDVEVRGSLQQLAYRQAIGASASEAGRIDRVQSYGGGIGYLLRGGIRLAANADFTRRRTDYGSAYEAFRYGLASSYAF